MLTYEQNVKAVLECIFAGYKDELIEDACRLICSLSRSENPNTCGDAISRQAAIEAIEALQRPIMREESNYYQFKFSGMSEAREAVENLPSVTPQQRTGRWRKVSMDKYIQHATYYYECSECGDQHIGQVNYCPNCGAKMEVEE